MEPVFTLSYSEYAAAQQLAAVFPSSKGYSLFVPLSRQEKGVDLLLARRDGRRTHVATVQVKSSRTYSRRPPTPRTRRPFNYYTWFNNFEMPREADFVLLVAVYPPEEARTSRRRTSWWSPVILAFSATEMRSFLRTVKTRQGKTDRMFGFGFDEPNAIFQTRGDQHARFREFSSHLLATRAQEIQRFLSAQ
jgi:hypothetical protein